MSRALILVLPLCYIYSLYICYICVISQNECLKNPLYNFRSYLPWIKLFNQSNPHIVNGHFCACVPLCFMLHKE